MPSSKPKPRVLLTNDDGPPTAASGSSPFVYPFARALREVLGWDVRVVVPSRQQSWVGKSYLIKSTVTGRYFYPTSDCGTEGETSELPRPLKDGEKEEWVLIDGTPASCANLGLYSLFPEDTFDLVISGPNYGRNSSTAFALSSGTIGAALTASFSHPAIALSWGIMEGHKPPGQNLVDAAVVHSCSVMERLWEKGWDHSGPQAAVFSVNVPLLPALLEPSPEVVWTTMARRSYARLFKPTKQASTGEVDPAGPAAVPEPTTDESKEQRPQVAIALSGQHHTQPLSFVFSPDLSSLVNPSKTTELAPGTDIHTIHAGAISITPILAAFEEVAPPPGFAENGGNTWKL